ncbi:cytochrome c-type biogenesis protein [Dongia soli]|uniref:Cytochrome c-type biogenesis protein n=1 Tax=Dongia soli TaxID=600628 RepID=A0ABU5EHK9_9PROT|nr:cytochrome c-type biogenesis protein [Dongia soli]MDY0885898.1 cytochrome c-type biogenesis protein [Dongia soli]
MICISRYGLAAGLVAGIAVLAFSSASFAVRPDEMLRDPVLEARAEAISRDIRCVVCQGESIEDSNADIAHELRVIVREQLNGGATDDQVQEYLVARYGDFVLLKPPFKAKTAFIWIGPFFLLLAGGIGVRSYYRRVARAQTAPLNAAEQARLEGILKTDDDRPNPDRNQTTL